MKTEIQDALRGMTSDQLRGMTELVARREALLQELLQVNKSIERMMSGDGEVRVPRDKQRGERIVEAIKAAGDRGLSSEEIGIQVGASTPTIYAWFSANAEAHPELEKVKDGTRVTWVWRGKTA